jgi:hypothetical protein
VFPMLTNEEPPTAVNMEMYCAMEATATAAETNPVVLLREMAEVEVEKMFRLNG